MNSNLEDDTVALEPPFLQRFSTFTTTSPRHSTREHQHNVLDSPQMYESPNDYDSDQMDPELEELFYTSIHHQTIGSMELTFDRFNQSTESQLSTPSKEAPVDEFSKIKFEDVKIFNTRKSLKKERKQIKVAREKALAAANAASQFTVEPTNRSRPKLDLCFGNLIVGDEITSTLDPKEAMNKFYNEDSYDSDEERANYKKMSSDKRFWKIGQEDMLSSFSRRSLPFRQKQCKYCNASGHLVKDCPRKLLCYICAGPHTGQKCRLRVCSICMELGHTFRKCPARYELKSKTCNTCGEKGHIDKQCTQSWRKFLNVTDEETYLAHINSKIIPDDPVVVNSIVSCSNCGAMRKHFTCECPYKDLSNMRFQMPPPVANWHKVRKEQTTKQNEPLLKSRFRKNGPQVHLTKSSSTTTQSSSINDKGKGQKRPCTFLEPEFIETPDDSDSNESVQYVLDLLKGSTQINDAPINSGPKRSQSHNKMNESAKKKRKANVSQHTAKFNYKQKSPKRKNNKSPSQNRLCNSHGTSEKISFKKKKREHCQGHFKKKTK